MTWLSWYPRILVGPWDLEKHTPLGVIWPDTIWREAKDMSGTVPPSYVPLIVDSRTFGRLFQW